MCDCQCDAIAALESQVQQLLTYLITFVVLFAVSEILSLIPMNWIHSNGVLQWIYNTFMPIIQGIIQFITHNTGKPSPLTLINPSVMPITKTTTVTNTEIPIKIGSV
jgi:hypothetical protein